MTSPPSIFPSLTFEFYSIPMNPQGDTITVPPAVPNPLQGPGGRRISSATSTIPLTKGTNGFDVGGSTVLQPVPTVPSPAPNSNQAHQVQPQIVQPPGFGSLHPQPGQVGPPFDAPRSPPGSKSQLNPPFYSALDTLNSESGDSGYSLLSMPESPTNMTCVETI